jgi:hypothetical protein
MFGEHLKEDILKPANFSYYRIYDQDFALDPPPEAVPCNSTNVFAEWVKGYGLVVWSAHGGSTGAGGFISSSMCSQLDDTKPSFTFQASCHNGRPEDSGNLGYALLKHGAVATVSASRQSGGWLGNNFNPSPTNGYNQDLAYYYAKDVVDGFSAAKALYQTIELSAYWPNNMIYNLYGDPSISLLRSPGHHPSGLRVSCHSGRVYWEQDENGLCGVMLIDIIWYNQYWWIKRPYDPWELDLQIGYNTARIPKDSSFLGKSSAINATLDLRYKIPLGSKVTPFLGAGPGLYYLGVTDTIAFGLNVCAGIDFRLTPRLALELGSSYHYLLGKSQTNFVQLTAGVLYDLAKKSVAR